jgi:transposase
MKIINNQLIIAFYDVTTLHFENESEDDFRKIGFSKEGKLNRPQIQLGLLTTLEGYPLAYEVYEGNRFEGKTLIETLVNFEKRFSLKQKPIIVADRGMLSNCNLIELHKKGYRYIIGSRIKALKDDIKTEIANFIFISDQDTKEIALDEELICREKNKTVQKAKIPQRIILSYSTQRLKKDNYLRKKGIERLKNKIQTSPNITKSDLKLSPYAKFLDLNQDCETKIQLNQKKITEDEKFDGIKGFITNDFSLSHQDIINHYKNLWYIEKAFKISKTDIRIRPIYHRLEHRIKAHILIAFVSYTIYKEFERRLQINNVQLPFSKKILRDIIKHIFAINIDGKFHYLKFDNIQQIIINSIY